MAKRERISTEDNQKFLNQIKELEQKISFYHNNETDFIESFQKLKHETEESNFLKDASLEREKHLIKQIQTINAELTEIPKRYMEKHEDQIQIIRRQFNLERRKFAEETSKLEELCARLQAQSERAIREKRAAESELDKLTRHIPEETDRLTMALEEMHSRLRHSERERNEAMHKVERYDDETNFLV
jgi:predicted  nucleic acid-binding Zn-ribbon protein